MFMEGSLPAVALAVVVVSWNRGAEAEVRRDGMSAMVLFTGAMGHGVDILLTSICSYKRWCINALLSQKRSYPYCGQQ
jgi:hypothetical protein